MSPDIGVLGATLLVSMMLTGMATKSLAVELPVRLSDLNASLADIAPRARSFPPKFSSAEERVQTEVHLKALLAQMAKVSDRYPDDKDILFLEGRANAMGHNLDFGGFLAGTTLMDQSISRLEKAIPLGEPRAHYTLAFVYFKKTTSTRSSRVHRVSEI